MLEIRPTSRFKRDLKICMRRGYDLDALGDVVDALARSEDCLIRTGTMR